MDRARLDRSDALAMARVAAALLVFGLLLATVVHDEHVVDACVVGLGFVVVPMTIRSRRRERFAKGRVGGDK